MLVSILFMAGGLALLLGGGEILLRGALGLAERSGLSPLLIGITVVAAATSMPELVVALTSGLAGAPDIGVGNVVGSNIANILLVLGATALVVPIATRPRHVLRDGLAVLSATLIFLLLGLAGTVFWFHGLVLLTLLAAYMAYCYLTERRHEGPGADEIKTAARHAMSPLTCALLLTVGMAGLVLGSKLLVEGAVEVARELGVSEAVIGLTMVAVGTSLPELATAVVASYRGKPEIALGNILGSNLFNLLGIIGALAITLPFEVAAEILRFDIWVMTAVSAVLIPVMLTGWRVGRLEGLLFLCAYALYVASQFDHGRLSLG